jgi:hypothetical protein
MVLWLAPSFIIASGLSPFIISNVKAKELSEIKIKETTSTEIINTTTTDAAPLRPTMHTFFERINDKDRFTGMSDEDDDALLTLWNESWTNAGWNTRLLTLADAQQAPHYAEFRVLLDQLQLDTFSRLLFERWMAMAAVVGGGWMVDYDVFPIRSFIKLAPNVGIITIYDNVAPAMASGNATEWLRTAMALVEHAQGHCTFAQQQNMQQQRNHQERTLHQRPIVNFWTDTLGLIHLIRNTSFVGPVSHKWVLAGHSAMAEPNVTAAFCNAKSIRSTRVVHFGPMAMQRGRYIPPQLRLPQHRAAVAREWLSQWYQVCNIQW